MIFYEVYISMQYGDIPLGFYDTKEAALEFARSYNSKIKHAYSERAKVSMPFTMNSPTLWAEKAE